MSRLGQNRMHRYRNQASNLGDRRGAFGTLRDAAAERCRAVTGEIWCPRHGGDASRTGALAFQ